MPAKHSVMDGLAAQCSECGADVWDDASLCAACLAREPVPQERDYAPTLALMEHISKLADKAKRVCDCKPVDVGDGAVHQITCRLFNRARQITGRPWHHFGQLSGFCFNCGQHMDSPTLSEVCAGKS